MTAKTSDPSHENEPAGIDHAGNPTSGSPASCPPRARGRRPAKRLAATGSKRPSRRLIETAGPAPASPITDVKLAVGRLAGTHGVDGELKMRVLTDHPDHLSTIRKVYLGESDSATALLGVRFQGVLALVRLEGVTSPEDGRKLGGLVVRIDGDDAVPLAEGEYFLYQLIGLTVVDESGQRLGTVSDLMETGAHDVLVISRDMSGTGDAAAGDLLVPNHPEFVVRIAPEENLVVIRPPQYAS